MPFIKFYPVMNADGWTAYQVSFDLGLIIKSKPGKTQIESFPRPFVLELADEPDVVAGLILADLAEDEGGTGDAADGVSDAEVRRALDAFFQGGPLLDFESGGRVVARYCADMRAALEGFLKARRL